MPRDRAPSEATDAQPCRAVFVLSCERSGSTLLRYLLDTHSCICSPGELGLGLLCRDISLVCSRTVLVGERDPVRKWAGASRCAREVVDAIMGQYAHQKGKSIWCDKAPMNLVFLDDLVRAFPDARYICLYRDALDVVRSCLDSIGPFGPMQELQPYVRRNPDNLTQAMVESWTHKTSKLIRFERRHPELTCRVRYEDLVEEPRATMRRLFRFLEVDDEPEVVDRALVVAHDPGGGDNKVHATREIETGSIGKGRSIDLSGVTPDLVDVLGMLMQEVNRDRPGPGTVGLADHRIDRGRRVATNEP